MPLMRHPRIKDMVLTVADDRVDSHLAQGWLHLLDEEQRERLAEMELEADLAPETSPAVVGNASGEHLHFEAEAKPRKRRPAKSPAAE